MVDDDERRHDCETTGCRFVRVGERAVQVRARYIAYVTRLPVDLAVYQIRSDEDSTFFLRRKGRHIYTYTRFRVTSHVASRFLEDSSSSRSITSRNLQKQTATLAK